MIVKTPDYIIADCGCPKWGANSRAIEDFATLQCLATLGDATNKRLLPLRETLTDYYARTLANKLEAWDATKGNTRHKQTLRSNNRFQDPATVKQMKTQNNETIKQQQQQHKHRNFTSSKPNILDKTRRLSSNSTATTTTSTKTFDSDLDVF